MVADFAYEVVTLQRAEEILVLRPERSKGPQLLELAHTSKVLILLSKIAYSSKR